MWAYVLFSSLRRDAVFPFSILEVIGAGLMMKQVLLTCIPTLTPLFTYFREKSTRGYYNRSGSNPMHPSQHKSVPLKSRNTSRLDRSDKWSDEVSDDNDSQRKIVMDVATQYMGDGQQYAGRSTAKAFAGDAAGESPFEMEMKRKKREAEEGIRATVTVEVKSEEAPNGDRSHQQRWKAVRGDSRDTSLTKSRKEREVLGM